MAKTKISEFSSTPANNTDIDSINIAEGCAPSGINDAIRELMSQLKDWQSGASNDPYVVGSSGSLTLNQGTANGVLYLNGSKVATSGSALTFDGTNLGVGTSSPAYKLDVNGTIRGAGDVISSATNPLFQGSSSTGSAAISNNTAGAYIRVYGSAHATKANYTDFINGSSTSTFDSSGNLGLGVTPSAWGSGIKSLDVSGSSFASSTGTLDVTQNAYYNGSGWIYKNTATSSKYTQSGGVHYWFNAPSGTAGNAITFTQAMTLSAAGNLLVGSTSDSGSKLQVGSASGSTSTPTAIEMDGTYGSSTYNGLKFYLYKGASESYGFGLGGSSDLQYWAGSSSTGVHRWFTSQTERARIDSSGNLLVGTTSANGLGGTTLNSGYALWNSSSNNTTRLFFWYNGSAVGTVTTTGTSTAYNTSSDQRLKENIQDADSASSLIDGLQVRKFDWKSDGSHQRYGFVAQELVTVAPEAVHQPEDTEEMMAVDYSKLVPMLVKEIQSLRVRVAQLESN